MKNETVIVVIIALMCLLSIPKAVIFALGVLVGVLVRIKVLPIFNQKEEK